MLHQTDEDGDVVVRIAHPRGDIVNQRHASRGVIARLALAEVVQQRSNDQQIGAFGANHQLGCLCRRLEQWYRDDRLIDRHMLALSTYVGHAKVTDTYWYVTATPELLALAARRAQRVAGRQL